MLLLMAFMHCSISVISLLGLTHTSYHILHKASCMRVDDTHFDVSQISVNYSNLSTHNK